MPPKVWNTPSRPQHGRQPSATKPDMAPKTKQASKEVRDAAAMPPPADPPRPPPPDYILGPEVAALENSLKTIVVKSAQVFKYYANINKLGVQKYVPRSPRSLTSSLGIELARYDQICDSLESQLSHATAIIQRDLSREEKRIQDEELERARAAAAAVATQNDTDTEMANPLEAPSESEIRTRQSTPVGKAPLRRPSKVSLSTLHRNPFPLKLDLSSASLRLDESSLSMSSFGLGNLGSLGTMGGLASPVTLAPKSARPMAPGEIPPEILAALATATSDPSEQDVLMQGQDDQRVDIDLTLDDDLQNIGVLGGSNGSVEQPIDVDMDLDHVDVENLANDFFGGDDGNDKTMSSDRQGVGGIFGPMGANDGSLQAGAQTIDMSFLNALSSEGQTDALFASLNEAQGSGSSSEHGPGFAANSSTTNIPFDIDQVGSMDDFLKDASKDMTQLLGTTDTKVDVPGGETKPSISIKPEETD